MRTLDHTSPLWAAVGDVVDPELGLSLSRLDMLRSVRLRRARRLEVDLALTTGSCPMRSRLESDVTHAVRRLEPGLTVRVTFTVMDERQRRAAAETFLRSDARRSARSATSVFAVASGKGGVGKSSVAANLAVALAAEGKSVGLLDADVWGYSVPQLFGVRRSPVALYETMLPVQAYGVRLMSLGFLVADETPVVWRGPMLHKALTQFVDDVHWGQLDVLVLDLPPGTGDVTLSVLELLPEAALLVVTTPQPAATTVAARIGHMARDAAAPIAGVVENMSGWACSCCGAQNEPFDSGGATALAESLSAPLLGAVPLDVELRKAGDRGAPLVATSPDAAAARALTGVAQRLRPVRRPLAGRSLPLTPV